jgi:outer membrane lipoprotein-sorting protein
MKNLTIIAALVCGSFLQAGNLRADGFDRIKSRLAEAGCVRLDFISILESRIFRQTDSTTGSAYISRDGRYRVTVGSDEYLCDGGSLYGYSPENNQVTIQTVDSTNAFSREVSYVTRLDEFFTTSTIKPNRTYRLVRKSTSMQNLPDSMTVTIDSRAQKILEIDYLDINDEPVRLVFTHQATDSTCTDSSFKPDFPDSVERVRM